MMILAFFLLVVAFVGATPSAIGNHNDVPSSTLGSRKQMDTSLYCGNWATGSRASAEALQKQLLACDDNTWGQSFTVKGTDDGEAGEPSPCIGLACDYVSAKDFHHTQFQLCNDGPHAVTKNCTEIAYWAQRLIDDCCVNPSSDGVSGQYFLGDGTNINLSYSAACHSDEQPSDPGPGMGSCVADS